MIHEQDVVPIVSNGIYHVSVLKTTKTTTNQTLSWWVVTFFDSRERERPEPFDVSCNLSKLHFLIFFAFPIGDHVDKKK